MAGGSQRPNMAEAEISGLKEALQSQQSLLQKLYAELEAEREASATATSETLSMIWRLQEEKAAEKMEANQYKRIAEEKMKHSEESMAIFHDIMYQKELEIASLEFQIQAYRYKLMSMGVSEPSFGEVNFDGNLFSRQDKGDLSVQDCLRKHKSLPAVEFRDQLSKMGILERTGTEDLSTYWEQIKQLDERVKALSHVNEVNEGGHSEWDSPHKSLQLTNVGYPEELDISSICSPVKFRQTPRGFTRGRLDEYSSCSSREFEDHLNVLEMDDYSIHSLDNENIKNVSQNVHDVFEVPETSDSGKLHGLQKQQGKKVVLEGSRLGKPDPIREEEEVTWVKNLLQFTHREKPLLSKAKDIINLNCHFASTDTRTGHLACQPEIQELNERLENLEGERRTVVQEISGSEEELRLLREMHQQLNTIESKLREIRNERRPREDPPSLDSIMEGLQETSVSNAAIDNPR